MTGYPRPGPRCRRAMQRREIPGQPLRNPYPVCGLPKGHAGYPERCLSEEAYEIKREYSAAWKRGRREADQADVAGAGDGTRAR